MRIQHVLLGLRQLLRLLMILAASDGKQEVEVPSGHFSLKAVFMAEGSRNRVARFRASVEGLT